ncbi:hypothetical protein HMN09_00730200 [Mycena chlorophos]|uniref:Serine hydrolase domain-containing protein n=1 Tax=Mycena chlorophos TaxID=658473 RepID=A0A8H6STC7_MYCCL|nr:hypothetical protein HMN09_00730200 [Mycena chlorophos]
MLPPRNLATPQHDASAFDAADALAANESRAWYQWNSAYQMNAAQVQESLLLLRDVLSTQRFDGIIGFSQGGSMAALLTALPTFLVDGMAPHPPFKFCIVLSGAKLRIPLAETIYADNFDTPTLHVIATNDKVVRGDHSWSLVAASNSARVETHDEGHYVPKSPYWSKLLADFILAHGRREELESLDTSSVIAKL